MNAVVLVTVFIRLVDELMDSNIDGNNTYILSNAGRYINVQAADFRGLLADLLAEKTIASQIGTNSKANAKKKTDEVLGAFRALGWIVCDNQRFTNTLHFNGRTQRVITVDKMRLDMLRSLNWNPVSI